MNHKPYGARVIGFLPAMSTNHPLCQQTIQVTNGAIEAEDVPLLGLGFRGIGFWDGVKGSGLGFGVWA